MTKEEVLEILDNIDVYIWQAEISEDIERIREYINNLK